MERQESLTLLKKHINNQNLIKHSLAVEAAMRALGKYFGEDEEEWALCGLLHDIDYEKTKENPKLHSKVGSEMLKEMGFPERIYQAVLTHNDIHGFEPETRMAKALYCVDSLTGLIVASTLILPSKKISDLKPDNILKRFREKAFARSANRESIKKSQDYLDLNLEELTGITLKAMQDISDSLGL
jgi:uncharacterized protein